MTELMVSTNAPPRIVAKEDDGVGWVVFDNPEHLNAFTPEMMADLHRTIERFEADDAVRVVVLRGSGDRAFSAGGDLKSDLVAQQRERKERPQALPSTTKPVIAMVHGVCIGHGVALAVAADIRLVADDARFAIPVARLGFAYPFDVLSRIVALVGPSAASLLCFTADTIEADEALRFGLVDRVVAKADLEASVHQLAQRIAARAPLSHRASKATIRAITSGEPTDIEQCITMIAATRTSEDAIEGRRAFLEKRPPRFQGR
jgi:enoyl-CoA hydratase